MDLLNVYYAIAVVLVLVGLAGTVLPALPGLPLVFAGMLLGAWAGGFEYIGIPVLVMLGLLTLFSLVVDFWATALGAKRVGASRLAVAGAVIGTFVGIFFGFIGARQCFEILFNPCVGSGLSLIDLGKFEIAIMAVDRFQLRAVNRHDLAGE